MTYANLKSKLNTLCTTAGITEFLFGYIDEFDEQNRAGTYPAMVVIPPNVPLKTRSKDERVVATVEIYILNSYTREGTTSRESAWDTCDTKMLLFIAALQSGTDFSLRNAGAVPREVFPFGLSTDSVVGVKYTLELDIFC